MSGSPKIEVKSEQSAVSNLYRTQMTPHIEVLSNNQWLSDDMKAHIKSITLAKMCLTDGLNKLNKLYRLILGDLKNPPIHAILSLNGLLNLSSTLHSMSVLMEGENKTCGIFKGVKVVYPLNSSDSPYNRLFEYQKLRYGGAGTRLGKWAKKHRDKLLEFPPSTWGEVTNRFVQIPQKYTSTFMGALNWVEKNVRKVISSARLSINIEMLEHTRKNKDTGYSLYELRQFCIQRNINNKGSINDLIKRLAKYEKTCHN